MACLPCANQRSQRRSITPNQTMPLRFFASSGPLTVARKSQGCHRQNSCHHFFLLHNISRVFLPRSQWDALYIFRRWMGLRSSALRASVELRYHISTTNLVKSLHLFHHLFTFYGICRVLCSNVYLLLLILLNGLYNKPNSEFKQTLKSFWLKVPNTTQDLTGNYNNPVMSVCYRVLFPVNHTSR